MKFSHIPSFTSIRLSVIRNQEKQKPNYPFRIIQLLYHYLQTCRLQHPPMPHPPADFFAFLAGVPVFFTSGPAMASRETLMTTSFAISSLITLSDNPVISP